jgi:hypothetical protein
MFVRLIPAEPVAAARILPLHHPRRFAAIARTVSAGIRVSCFVSVRHHFHSHSHSLRMIAPETFSHLEDIKKRAGHLWRFL